MRLWWEHIRRGAAWLAAFVVACAITAPVGNFFIVWADQHGWYKNPSGTVHAVTGWVVSSLGYLTVVTGSVWFHWAGGGIVGFAIGAWLDAMMRRKEERGKTKKAISGSSAISSTHGHSSPIDAQVRKALEDQQRDLNGTWDPATRQFTNKTADQLLSLFDGRTPLQAAPLIQPFLGLWIHATGRVMMTLDGGMDAIAIIRSGRRTIECRFPKKWEVALRRYDKGAALCA